jgi:hypothetical protein
MKGRLVVALGIATLAIAEAASAGSVCVASADKGQDLRTAGKLKDARSTFLTCAQSTCNAVVRADCERWIREIDKEMPSVVVRVTDARRHDVLGVTLTIDDARIERDGSAPILVDPGTHVVRARTPSGDVAEAKAHVVVGERARIVDVRFDRLLDEDGGRVTETSTTASPESAPPPSPATASNGPPVLPIALASVGVAALGTFAWFQWQGRAGYEDLENGCAKTRSCTDEQMSPVKTQFTISAVALGVSAVALGAAAYFFFFADKGESKTTGGSKALRALAPGGLAF